MVLVSMLLATIYDLIVLLKTSGKSIYIIYLNDLASLKFETFKMGLLVFPNAQIEFCTKLLAVLRG